MTDADYVPPPDAPMTDQILWAGRYNGYAMLAQDPSHLAEVLRPVVEEHAATGRVPDWAGEHLLRGWLFFLVRADRHGGGYQLAPGSPTLRAWTDVMERLRLLRRGEAGVGGRR